MRWEEFRSGCVINGAEEVLLVPREDAEEEEKEEIGEMMGVVSEAESHRMMGITFFFMLSVFYLPFFRTHEAEAER
jgi:hypothetical protein